MATSSKNIAGVTQQMFDLLDPLESGDPQRIISAVMTLLGEQGAQGIGSHGPGPNRETLTQTEKGSTGGSGSAIGAQVYFDSKEPHSKQEELAVAARYRELHEDSTTHTRQELQKVITTARRGLRCRQLQQGSRQCQDKGVVSRLSWKWRTAFRR